MASGGVVIKIDGDDSGYRKKLSALGNATKAVVKGFAALGTAVGAAWSAVGVVGVKYNSEIEQLQTSFEVMSGSAEKAAAVVERLRDIGAKAPFDLAGLASTTQLLMNYGFEADRAVDEMLMLGDIAQGNAEALNSIAMGYAQMSSLGKVNLQDIKQMINGGFNPLQEISERTGESMEKLYARISKGKMAVSEITESMKHATSEGGRYYQSMEKQAQTFQGRLDTLKEDATAFTGSIMASVSEKLRDTIIPMASEMLADLQAAFDRGGIDGVIDELTSKIPVLVEKAVAGAKQLMGGITKWLPGAVKQLATAIPSAVRAIVDIAPQIVSSLFDVVSSLVSELITMLPELVPVLVEGVVKLLESVWNGALKLLDGIFGAIYRTADREEKRLNGVIDKLFAGVDKERGAELSAAVKASLSTEITTDDYQAKIDEAILAIETALTNIPALDGSKRDAIKAAIINGTGLDLLKNTLAEMLPQAEADAIIAAVTTINTSLETLGLSDEAKDRLAQIIGEGGDAAQIREALISFGVEDDVATATAQSITDEMGKINTAVEGLGLDSNVKDALTHGVMSDRSAIITALQMYGLSDTEISSVLAGYETLSNNLTAKAKLVFSDLATVFTDGLPDNEEEAKAAVKAFYTDLYGEIDGWRKEALKELEDNGLTGDDLANATAEIEQQYTNMTEAAKNHETAAMDWVEENANRSTEFVEGNLAALQDILAMTQEITAQIDVLTNKAFDSARSRRTLVQAGAISNQEHQLEAFAITSAELQERLQQAELDAAKAFDQAAKDFKNDADGYAAREDEILQELAGKQATAYAAYDEENRKTIAGIIKNNPELYEQLTQYAEQSKIKDGVDALLDGIQDAVNNYREQGGKGEIDVSALLESLGISEIDAGAIAEALGVTPEEFRQLIHDYIARFGSQSSKSADSSFHAMDDNLILGMLKSLQIELPGELSDYLESMDIDLTDSATVLSQAIEDGWLQTGLENIDLTTAQGQFALIISSLADAGATGLTDKTSVVTDAASGLADAAADEMDISDKTSASGANAGDSFANALLKKINRAKFAGKSFARAAIDALNSELGIASPAKEFIRSGEQSGDGYVIGWKESMRNAIKTARETAVALVGAANLPQRTSSFDVSQGIAAAMGSGDAPTQPIYMQMDGKIVARIQARDNRTAMSRYNRRIALGVGK